MFSFKKIISFFSILGILFFQGFQPIHASGEKNSSLIISGNLNLSECSNFDFHCEKIDDSTYFCEKNSSLSVNQQIKTREIPFGYSGQSGLCRREYISSSKSGVPQSLGENYIDPEPFIYPFVRIIKIQI